MLLHVGYIWKLGLCRPQDLLKNKNFKYKVIFTFLQNLTFPFSVFEVYVRLSLLMIFKNCLVEKCPKIWKTYPIMHKKSNKCLVKNRRPVSFLPICVKIFEGLTYNSLYFYLVKYKLIIFGSIRFSDLRFSYTKQFLPITIELFLHLMISLRCNRFLLDISKAVDKLWYDGLHTLKRSIWETFRFTKLLLLSTQIMSKRQHHINIME